MKARQKKDRITCIFVSWDCGGPEAKRGRWEQLVITSRSPVTLRLRLFLDAVRRPRRLTLRRFHAIQRLDGLSDLQLVLILRCRVRLGRPTLISGAESPCRRVQSFARSELDAARGAYLQISVASP